MNVIIAIAIFSTPMFARIVRSQTLSVLNSQYVRAAKTMGASSARIMFKHIIPSTVSSVLVYFTMRVGTSVLTAASLSSLALVLSHRRRSGALCWHRAATLWRWMAICI
ncbi:dipeptide transport system permease protein dppC [Vibrio ishigakensis]|uniref:Dipeptide transport system permease protein dppC n=1 Tax=Vibrio ishigakensis TaxID=1481914 RepID=A0A0B8P221_9VIBR|nr:dipeptide transport system permease protein dppC [Vibrio ishigakensis]